MAKNKFKVAPVAERTLDGILFASKKEMARYADLKMLEKGKVISNLELQPSFPVSINDTHFCTYTADFRYEENGQTIIEELKSSGTAKDPAYRLRKKAAELYYGIKIKVNIQ
jgi:hypothetical protein